MELARTIQRKPYNAGMPVRGEQFYGRSELINNILGGSDRAIWVVSNRRIGKTSLLRRMEQLGSADGRVAFMISMEAADNVADESARVMIGDSAGLNLRYTGRIGRSNGRSTFAALIAAITSLPAEWMSRSRSSRKG